jgi:hypothetical protein
MTAGRSRSHPRTAARHAFSLTLYITQRESYWRTAPLVAARSGHPMTRLGRDGVTRVPPSRTLYPISAMRATWMRRGRSVHRQRVLPGTRRARHPARNLRQVGPVVAAEAAQESLLLPPRDPREGGALDGQPRPDRRAAVEQRQPSQARASPAYIGLRLSRYGPRRSRYCGVSPDSSVHPRGAAWQWAASAHVISPAPAATATSPAPRTAGLLAGRPARSSSRDNSNGTTACNATAPAVQTSTPAGLGMRFT